LLAGVISDAQHGTKTTIPSSHHTKYTNAEAITAVEAEDPLNLAGDVIIASGKKLGIGATPTFPLYVYDISSGQVDLTKFHGKEGFIQFRSVDATNRMQMSIMNNVLVAANTVFDTYVTGDTATRFGFTGSGKILWSSGAAAHDTNLYRSAANVLKTDDALDAASFRVGGVAGASGNFTTVDGKTVTVVNGIITAIV